MMDERAYLVRASVGGKNTSKTKLQQSSISCLIQESLEI